MKRNCRKLFFFGACTLSFLFCGILGTLNFGESPHLATTIVSSLKQEHCEEYYYNSTEFSELVGSENQKKIAQLPCQIYLRSESASKRDSITQYARKRIKMHDPSKEKNVSDCTTIRRRWKFAHEASSREERDFPIAFLRTVFKDYLLLEEMLSVEYQPQNVYCYALDLKANATFKSRIRYLAKCFDNMIVPEVEYSVESNGKNVTRSQFACLKALREQKMPWEYAIILQNHDIPLKTNREMVQILKLFNGTNDLSTMKIMPASVNTSLNWTFAHLQLYRDGAKNEAMLYENNVNSSHNNSFFLKKIQHTKSLVAAELSRKAVDFLLDELTVESFISELEKARYGMDEVLISTLNSNLQDMPGGFTQRCLYEENRQISGVGRYTVWERNVEQCKSGKFRHFSCVFGIEDLEHLASQEMTQLYFNKMMPGFDYGAVHCWLKNLKRRALDGTPKINAHFYRNLPHVRYNRLKSEQGNQTGTFQCR